VSKARPPVPRSHRLRWCERLQSGQSNERKSCTNHQLIRSAAPVCLARLRTEWTRLFSALAPRALAIGQEPRGTRCARGRRSSLPERVWSDVRREARRAREISRRCAAVAGWLSAGAGLLASGTGLAAEQVCRPAVTIAQARLSDVDSATAARSWTALISIDSSRCAPGASGSFQLVLLRLKENGPDLRFRPFREGLPWQGPATKTEVPFSADEAVGRAWIEDVSPCACVP
jgi:hypothetical protein